MVRTVTPKHQPVAAVSRLPASPRGEKKPIVIGVITIVALLLVIALVYFIPKTGVGAGKAVQQTAPGTFAGEGVDNIRFESAALDGAVGDQFTLPVYIRTNEPITQINFELSLPDNIELVPTGCITNVNCQIDTHTSLGSVYYPSATNPVWSVAGTTALQPGADIKVFTLHLRVTGGAVDSANIISLTNVHLLFETSRDEGPFTTSATLTVAAPCVDIDGDGYGAVGTDLRACSTANQGDCNDASSTIKPGATELCDGVDNDCDASIDGADSGLTGTNEYNDNVQGVCFGRKICTGTGGWANSYSVSDPISYDVPAVTFTSPDGIFNQQDLYNAGGELCDFFDNDCDGEVNEMIECGLGAPSLVGAPPGNVFIDYDAATSMHSDPQLLQTYDRWLFNKMKNLQDQGADADCGLEGFAPCTEPWITGATSVDIHYCYSGVYYLEILTGATAGDVFRYSPEDDLEGPMTVSDIDDC